MVVNYLPKARLCASFYYLPKARLCAAFYYLLGDRLCASFYYLLKARLWASFCLFPSLNVAEVYSSHQFNREVCAAVIGSTNERVRLVEISMMHTNVWRYRTIS